MGKQWKQWQIFIFLGSKTTVDCDCSHGIKTHFAFGRKAMTNLHRTLKNRHYFADKGPSSQSCGFPVVMYGCEGWTIKKAEHQRIDAFKQWCWRRILRVPWTSRRSNQSNLQEISPGWFIGRTDVEAETLILWPSDAKSSLIWEDPDAGKD